MENISYGIFTIFIAFVLFSVIRNVFFNANQLSKIIRRKYLRATVAYFSTFIIGISGVVLTSKADYATYIILDISFVGLSLPVIFTSIRIDSNDTSAYNKWYFSQENKPTKDFKDNKETTAMQTFYGFIIIVSLGTLLSAIILVRGEVEQMGTSISFVSFSSLLAIIVVGVNNNELGSDIRKNLLYNYLWEKKQNKIEIKQFKSDELYGLFIHLFCNSLYKSNEEKNDQILMFIDKCRFVREGRPKYRKI